MSDGSSFLSSFCILRLSHTLIWSLFWNSFLWEQKVQISKVNYGAAFHCTQLSFLFVFALTIKVTGVIIVTVLPLKPSSCVTSRCMICWCSFVFSWSTVSQHLKQKLEIVQHFAKIEEMFDCSVNSAYKNLTLNE